MRIGILGTGVVGSTIATRLVAVGYDVRMGSRSAGGEKATQWVRQAGGQSSEGTFADAAAHGEIVFNCTSGAGSLDALRAAGSKNLSDKILVDVANPLDFSHGMPPTLFVCNTDSLGEQIQRAYPQAKVVKTLNTVTSAVMVNPSLIAAEQTMFISGNDTAAKETVIGLLKRDFGWEKVFDLGDITGARAQEMHLALWLRLFVTLQTPNVNIDVAR
ncbi:MAG TPA: NAD(P)-binding domain-containing protein [Gemmatimonadaceae bacterium]|jgi:predicted dinucleotide-binding enzyme|nr:NAD(P)-binding domain-containing protein [Gemmatimonadaceae bacterium]